MKNIIFLVLFTAFSLGVAGQDDKSEPSYIIVYTIKHPPISHWGELTTSRNRTERRVEAFNSFEELQNRLTFKQEDAVFYIPLYQINEGDLIAVYDVKRMKKIPFVYESKTVILPDRIIIDTVRGKTVTEKRFILKPEP